MTSKMHETLPGLLSGMIFAKRQYLYIDAIDSAVFPILQGRGPHNHQIGDDLAVALLKASQPAFSNYEQSVANVIKH